MTKDGGADRALDAADWKILDLVQRDNRLPAEKIAGRVGLSSSAVQRRLKRLRESGTIRSDVALIPPERVGRKLTVIVEVTIGERPLQRVFSEFKRLMLATDEVQQCYHVTGRADFILVITAADVEEYEALTRKLFVDNPNVARFETSIVVNKVKFTTTVPLGAARK
jgi:Lrp/AsnC family leucine-responsive transcriptional regulator